jgi:pimeloyl-ACP methyl ester carboxylesterase
MKALKHLVLIGLTALIACSPSDPVEFDPRQSDYFSEQDQMLELDTVSVRYRRSGPEDAQTIVLIHGFTDSLHSWDRVVETLEDDFHLLRFDLPGHGLSSAIEDNDYSNENTVRLVKDVLDALAINQPVLVGNSLGGLVAWRLAAQSPDQIKGLVLLSPGGVPFNGVGEEPVSVPAMMKFYLKSAPEAGVRTALKAMHANPDRVSDMQVATYRDMMRIPGNGEAFVARAEQFTLPDPQADMARITAPTQLLWGDADVLLPVEQADTFQQNIAQATVTRLPDVGHLPHWEAPELVTAAIRTMAESHNALPSEENAE